MSRNKGQVSKDTASASGIVVSANLLAKFIDLTALIVLARLLTPADFGLVAMAMTLVLIVEKIFDVPLGTGIIRAKRASKIIFDTAFTLSLLRGALVALLIIILGYPVSAFYGDPRLINLFWALAFAPAIRGLVSPRSFLFQRRLDYRLSSTGDLIGKLVAFIVGVSVAFTTKSYWAIAIMTLLAPIILTSFSYIYAPYKPRLSLKSFDQFSDILGWSTLNQTLSAVNWQVDRLILGGYIPVGTFGKYTMAATLASLPQQILIAPILRPINASFAKLKDKKRLAEAYLKSTQALMLIAMPVLIVTSIYAESIINLLFDKNWSEAIYILRYFCVIALIALPTHAYAPIAIVMRQLKTVSIASSVELVIRVSILIFAIKEYGIYGALTASAFAAACRLIIVAILTKKMLATPILTQISIHKRNLMNGILIACVATTMQYFVINDSWIALFLSTAAGVALSFIIYILTGYLFWRWDKKPAGPEEVIFGLGRLIMLKLFWQKTRKL